MDVFDSVELEKIRECLVDLTHGVCQDIRQVKALLWDILQELKKLNS